MCGKPRRGEIAAGAFISGFAPQRIQQYGTAVHRWYHQPDAGVGIFDFQELGRWCPLRADALRSPGCIEVDEQKGSSVEEA